MPSPAPTVPKATGGPLSPPSRPHPRLAVVLLLVGVILFSTGFWFVWYSSPSSSGFDFGEPTDATPATPYRFQAIATVSFFVEPQVYILWYSVPGFVNLTVQLRSCSNSACTAVSTSPIIQQNASEATMEFTPMRGGYYEVEVSHQADVEVSQAKSSSPSDLVFLDVGTFAMVASAACLPAGLVLRVKARQARRSPPTWRKIRT